MGDEPLHLGLIWGIKRTFIEYVRRMQDGKGWIGDGARPLSDERIFFEFDPDASSPDAWSFRGDVRFSGHFGMLFVQLANPVIHRGDEPATLTIGDERLELVTMRLELLESRDGLDYWHAPEPRLAAAGVELFNDVYPLGEPFEPIVLLVPSSEVVEAQY